MRQLRQLEELNLVDDFLVNSLTIHKVYGEPAARCILECILGRKIGKLRIIPQHFVPGEDTDEHGIRIDVYLDEVDGELFDLVMAVKRDGKVGLTYMKSFEIEQKIRREGIKEGKAENIQDFAQKAFTT
ncbi:MAG: hypothetical protein K2K87_08235 [Lachnospiraceae bacterium]|nr:hypothetical protein [Lachnospiraceae bacterium]